MSAIDRISEAITEHSIAVILVLVLVTAALGAGAGQVKQSSGLDQFQTDTPEADAQNYVQSNFSTGAENTTTVQVIVRNESGNVLSKSSLVSSLEFQQRLRDDPQVNETLAENNSIIGVANVVAITAIRTEQADKLQDRADELERRNQSLQQERRKLEGDRQELQRRSDRLNRTAADLSTALNRTRDLQHRYFMLNVSHQRGEIDNATYRRRSQAIESDLASTRANATDDLTDAQAANFTRAFGQVRAAQRDLDQLNASLAAGKIDEQTYRQRAGGIQQRFQAAYRLGTQGVLASEYRELQARGQELKQQGQQLEADFEQLQQDAEQLKEDSDALRNAPQPTLQEQIDQLRSMNQSEINDAITTVLGKDDGSDGGSGGASDGRSSDFAFQLMSTHYEPGQTTATARMVIIRQSSEENIGNSGSAPETIQDAQLQVQTIAQDQDDGNEYLVFGVGIISQEIDQSMTDSLKLVSPLAIIFVLITLLIAYRDLLDILLGLVGIGVVLLWTFGFMGWANVDFNQVMVAVPVLLIGLSIDYAIHIFMRHREQRQAVSDGPRGSMKVALGGVGIALVWVTATTVIGFLSNLISPVGPIRDFGIVSSVGIVAALFVFGALIPAIKVEGDELLESLGFDREKRAFGTGGGYLASALSVGSKAARRGAPIVIALSLLVTVAGAYGATQVSTSFAQEDFLAQDPPQWMDDLPQQVRPGDYTAKDNLDYVNQNFQREDSEATVLLRSHGDASIASEEALRRLQEAQDRAEDDDVTLYLANGEAAIQSPLSVMRDVAATNDSFDETFQAADTNGDGIPDRDVAAVYDKLYEVAPDRAKNVLYRNDDGEYVAARMTVSVKGGESTSAVTEAARDWADPVEGGDNDGFTAIATGGPVVNEVVQQDLLETVIQSLAISLIAVFLFLMVTYRITEGSATLGMFTLLPVALSVAWILGTMYVAGMPFNVLTGMITSLTIGLGVAYSIHVSERFNLELERQGDLWGAMDTAVTGTGGALLGSAATTVGGFGTLAIAILPPLQQFGIITAMTIIYAFLASVLILPSLLVVWVRTFGPDVEEMEPEGEFAETTEPAEDEPAEFETGDPGVAETVNGDETTVGAEPAELDADPKYDEVVSADAAADADDADADRFTVAPDVGEVDTDLAPEPVEDDESSDGSIPIGLPDSDDTTDLAGTPARSVDPRFVVPGGSVTVTVRVPECRGRVMLVEGLPGVGGRVLATDPDPVTHTKLGDKLLVLWETDEETDCFLQYTLRVPDDVEAGAEIELGGHLEADDGRVAVEGTNTIDVVTEFVGEVLADGTLTPEELERARNRVDEGLTSEKQLQWLYREWLLERPDRPPETGGRTDPTDDAGSVDTTGEDD